MSVFQLPIRIIPRLGARTIVHGPSAEFRKNPSPVKLSFASYEDTKTREDEDRLKSPPLLIIHGLFGSKNNWNSICKALQQRTIPSRKIIAVDARNHGDSAHSNIHTYQACAEDIKSLLETERIPQVAIMGHSMGGRIAMYLALSNPNLIERLIVVDISPFSNGSDLKRNFNIFTAMAAVRVPPKTPLSDARTYVNAALMSAIPDKRVRQFILTNLVQKPDGTVSWRLNIRALRENFAHIGQFPLDPSFGAYYMGPTTFIAGGASDYLPVKDHALIIKLFPNATFQTIPGTGHWVHSEKPNEFIEIVLGALSQPKKN